MSSPVPNFDSNRPPEPVPGPPANSSFPSVIANAKPSREIQAKRQEGAALATRLAALGWLLPIIVLVAAPLFVVLHVAISELQVWWWWIPLAAVWVLALFCTFYAFANLPRPNQPGRGWVLGQIIAGILLLIVSGGAFGLSALIMSFLLYAKSDEGRRALAERRAQEATSLEQRRIAARQQVFAEQQAQAKKRELARQKRQAEQDAEWRKIEAAAAKERAAEEKRLREERTAEMLELRRRQEAASKKATQEWVDRQQQKEKQDLQSVGNYRLALQEMLLVRDNGQPLPKVTDARLAHHEMKATVQQHQMPSLPALDLHPEPLPADQQLFDEPFTSDGHAVRRLKIPAADLVPMLACEFWYQKPTLWLLEKKGRLLEISLPDWKPRQTWDLGVPCHYLNANEPALLILGNEMAIRIDIHDAPYVSKFEKPPPPPPPPNVQRMKVVKPLRIQGFSSVTVETGSSTPLLAEGVFFGSTIHELKFARDEKSPVLASYLARDVEVAQDGTFHVPHRDGIYRGLVNPQKSNPDELREGYRRLNYRQAQFNLAGNRLYLYENGWTLADIKWTKVMPADNIDLDKFTTLHDDLLATCNADTNLLLFDREGKQLSTHAWPGAGRTVNIQSLPSQNQLVVFTENHVYFVAGPQKVKPVTGRPET